MSQKLPRSRLNLRKEKNDLLFIVERKNGDSIQINLIVTIHYRTTLSNTIDAYSFILLLYFSMNFASKAPISIFEQLAFTISEGYSEGELEAK